MPEDEKLLGDEVEEILKKIGADKLAEAFEEATDSDCGCDKRKEWLNKLHLWWKNNLPNISFVLQIILGIVILVWLNIVIWS